MRVVIDASAMGPLIIPDEANHEHPGLIDILSAGAALVPSHWHLEVANLGRSAIRRSRLEQDLYAEQIAFLGTFEIEIDRLTPDRAWSIAVPLATRHELTPYDAAYLELAIRRRAPLLCRDAALEAAAKAERVELL